MPLSYHSFAQCAVFPIITLGYQFMITHCGIPACMYATYHRKVFHDLSSPDGLLTR